MDRLDDLDRAILHQLQLDARRTTDSDIGERTGVTGTTVANRIRNLEERGVIRGYYPLIDYEAAGYPLVVLFVCTVPLEERSNAAERALDVVGVTGVCETMASEQNVLVTAVGESKSRIEQVARRLGEIGLTITRSDMLANERVQTWDHFYLEMLDESAQNEQTNGDGSGPATGDRNDDGNGGLPSAENADEE